MKALTLYHPWAMFIETGWKEVETRDWYTAYRGPLAIHASKHYTPQEAFAYADIVRFVHVVSPEDYSFPAIKESMGCVVAICRLSHCVPAQYVESVCRKFKDGPFEPKHGWRIEKAMGNYEAGRWAWILRDVMAVDPPIPARGYQKLWDWHP